jgi:DNA-binding helix-hairpin-helix protein with protein kinase domain
MAQAIRVQEIVTAILHFPSAGKRCAWMEAARKGMMRIGEEFIRAFDGS